MGQCFSTLSGQCRRGTVHPLDVKESSRSSQRNARNIPTVDKTEKTEEDAKLAEVEGQRPDGNSHDVEESDSEMEVVTSITRPESFILDKLGIQDETDVEETVKDSVELENGDQTETNTNAVSNTDVRSEDGIPPKAGEHIPGVTAKEGSIRMIFVQSAPNSEFSLGSRDSVAYGRDRMKSSWPNLNQVSSLITQKTTCTYRYQGPEGKVGVVKKEWDAEGLQRLANTVAQPSECGLEKQAQRLVENKGFLKSVVSEDVRYEDENNEKRLEQGHLLTLGLSQEGKMETKKTENPHEDGIAGRSDNAVVKKAVRQEGRDSKSITEFNGEHQMQNKFKKNEGNEVRNDKIDRSQDIPSSSKNKKPENQTGAAVVESNAEKSQTVTPSKKAQLTAHLIVKAQLFGHVDETVSVKNNQSQTRVSLGIPDEDFWLPGLGNTVTKKRTTMTTNKAMSMEAGRRNCETQEDKQPTFKDGDERKQPQPNECHKGIKKCAAVGSSKRSIKSLETVVCQKTSEVISA